MQSESSISQDARRVLRALAVKKNVIISGPPGTGKSRLLNQVRDAFRWQNESVGADPYGAIPIPPAAPDIPNWFPSPECTTNRSVFPTVFDQNTKYRDFMRGLVPDVALPGAFTITNGTLYRAALAASQDSSAALVIVDEINRGPAVAAFGSALVALEADKRRPSSGATRSTQEFEVLGDNGENHVFSLPASLYVLAAMNEADTSVEPLDVAFLRRFEIIRLKPDAQVLRAHFKLDDETPLPARLLSSRDLYESLVQAWAEVNRQISLGRGTSYQLGHGALMHQEAPIDDLDDAAEYVAHTWLTLRAHIEEVFFGNARAIAEVLRADDPTSPFSLLETTFAGQNVRRVSGDVDLSAESLFELFRSMSRR